MLRLAATRLSAGAGGAGGGGGEGGVVAVSVPPPLEPPPPPQPATSTPSPRARLSRRVRPGVISSAPVRSCSAQRVGDGAAQWLGPEIGIIGAWPLRQAVGARR